jgi:hypothetical protein
MGSNRGNSPEFLLPGDTVQVRPWAEIRETLDASGLRDALPFMPEMARYCGQRFTVSKRIERTCEEIEKGMRRIRNIVFLENLRCDGTAHGGCQKGCFLFWKEAWLKRDNPDAVGETVSGEARPDPFPYPYAFPDGQYVCQSTELMRATSPLPAWDPGMFLRDIRAKTYSPWKLLRVLSYAMYLRVRKRVTGKSYRYLEGKLEKTPRGTLNLQAGERVRVKPEEEIVLTLDRQGKNRGLAFTVEMRPFCRETHRVLRRLEKMIHEPTRKLVDVEDTVILENVTCDGCHILRGGCPRENYHFWREIWLQRVPGP